MQAYVMFLGLEHLQSGIEFEASGSISFEIESPTIFKVWSWHPFHTTWKVRGRRRRASGVLGPKPALTEYTRAEMKENRKAYRENAPQYPLRIVKGRERIEVAS